MGELPQPVLAIVGTRRDNVDTLFAFRAGSDPASVLREARFLPAPFFATGHSPHLKLDLDRILVVPDDIDKCGDVHDFVKPLLKATRTVMTTQERREDLYNSDVIAIYLGSTSYFSRE